MPKTLVIAEKPAMAQDIAKALGGLQKRNGYLESEEYIVTWAIGHLVELLDPDEYRPEWKRWSAATLPIVPPEFGLKPSARTKSQFEIIKRLCRQTDVTSLINACDAGREGELIFRYIVSAAGCRKPFRRLWISSLTSSAIRQGFSTLRAQEQMEPLYEAAQCRAQSDWLVGINATRAVTVTQGGRSRVVYSLGRVQTPTLALIVQREDELRQFEPKPFWEIEAQFSTEMGDYKGKWFSGEETRFWQQVNAEEIVARIAGKPGKVRSYRYVVKEEAPPLLYDLTSLQREANRRYSFSASKTLKLAQSLYEQHKLITYPRTDSRFITPDLIPSLPARVEAVGRSGPFGEAVSELLTSPKLPISGRMVNKAKVRDHHAIIPTETAAKWDRLGRDEAKIYELVCRAFLGCFFPPAKWGHAEAMTEVDGELFKSQGKTLLDAGWRKLLEQRDRDEQQLPSLREGLDAQVTALEIKDDITKPPSRYTEGTLLGAMERAGKLVLDEEFQEAMKDSGLGTPATRAAIIERLKTMDYIVSLGKELQPTPKGTALIHYLPVPSLKSPEMTGQWEYKLHKVEEGELTAKRFMTEMTCFVSDMVSRCLQGERMITEEAPVKVTERATEKSQQTSESVDDDDEVQTDSKIQLNNKIQASEWGSCPLCGGTITENNRGYGCSNWHGSPPCRFVIWKTIAKKKLTPNQVRMLLSKGKTSLIKGFVSTKGTKFSAHLKLQESKVVFEFAGPK